MADTKLSALTADTAPGLDSLLYTVDDPAGTPVSRKTTVGELKTALAFARDVIGGRLTLTSGDPVSGTSTSTATTVLYTPYLSDEISLWDGTHWVRRQFTELTNTLTNSTTNPAAATTDAGYDLFVWDNAGVLTLSRGPLWSSIVAGSGARGTGAGTTELELYEGRYVNKVAISNGPAARYGRYVGSFRTNANAGPNAEDTAVKRYVWNMYNRINRRLFKDGGSSAHTYDNATIRQYNAGTGALEVQAFVGLVEDMLLITANMIVQATATGSAPRFGFDINATTTYLSGSNYNFTGVVATIRGATALPVIPTLGTSIVYMNENGNATTANIFDFGRIGGLHRC